MVKAVSGETYSIEYDEQQRTQPWLETDDCVLEVDVRGTVTAMSHTDEMVSELRAYDMTTDQYPEWTVTFVNRFVVILEQQGAGE